MEYDFKQLNLEKLTKKDLEWIETRELKPESVKDKELLKKIHGFCYILYEKCERIQEIDIIGSFVTGNFNQHSDIDLVCIIQDLKDAMKGYEILYPLIRNTIGSWIKLGITYPLDLGFYLDDGSIFVLGGLISGYKENLKNKFLPIFSIERDIII